MTAVLRKNGVSGMMRVRNDSEFIEACVESCIDAIDELIIVYNDCNEDSIAMINKVSTKYHEKVKVFKYDYNIIAWNLDDEIINEIISGEIPPKNTLAGYYNYALSKTSYKYAMKIDADQIYNSEKLTYVCNLYRSLSPHKRCYNSYLYIFLFLIYFNLAKKIKILRFEVPSWLCKKYYKSALNIIKCKKKNGSLSGINIYIDDNKYFVPIGMNTPQNLPNIMVPYNGEGDHPIFKVTKDTKFIPIRDKRYESLTKNGKSVIEKLVGIGSIGKGNLLMLGVCWVHLNSNRISNSEKQKIVFNKYREYFFSIKEFQRSSIKSIANSCSSIANWLMFDYNHKLKDSFIDKIKHKLYFSNKHYILK